MDTYSMIAAENWTGLGIHTYVQDFLRRGGGMIVKLTTANGYDKKSKLEYNVLDMISTNNVG